MANRPAQSITKHFASVKDPRTGNAKQHLLLDILVITKGMSPKPKWNLL
jgi:hypothetical protein